MSPVILPLTPISRDIFLTSTSISLENSVLSLSINDGSEFDVTYALLSST